MISAKLNGKQRNAFSIQVKVDGKWKQGMINAKTSNGWKPANSFFVEDDITGFEMIYIRCDESRTHNLFPSLKVNYDLPVNFHLTGNSSYMDLIEKGVIFEYTNDYPDKEGVYMYEGKLYAVINDQLVDIGYSGGSDQKLFNQKLNRIVWCTNRFDPNMNISLIGHVSFESYGFYVAGWNSFMSTEHILDETKYPVYDNKNVIQVNSSIIPLEDRSKTFDSLFTIGIARDMHTPHMNMIGSIGHLDHTITKILVNETAKPFSIKIIN